MGFLTDMRIPQDPSSPTNLGIPTDNGSPTDNGIFPDPAVTFVGEILLGFESTAQLPFLYGPEVAQCANYEDTITRHGPPFSGQLILWKHWRSPPHFVWLGCRCDTPRAAVPYSRFQPRFSGTRTATV